MPSADVVVIGAGLAGQAAALQIKRRQPQAEVLIIDKAKLPGSGLSGRFAGLLRFFFHHASNRRLAAASRDFYQEAAAAHDLFAFAPHDAFISPRPDPGDELFASGGGVEDAGTGDPGDPLSGLDGRLGRREDAGSLLRLPGAAAAVRGADLLDLFWMWNHHLGVRYRLEDLVLDIELRQNRVRRVATARESVETDHVVLASGTGTRELAELLGLALPVELWRVTLAQLQLPDSGGDAAPELRLALEPGVWLHQTPYGLQLGRRMPLHRSQRGEDDGPVAMPAASGTHWNWQEGGAASDPPMLDWGSLAALLRDAVGHWPRLADSAVRREWAVHYAMTPDQLPLLGAAPGIRGLYLAAGFNGYGASILPAAAQALAALVSGEEPGDVAAFDPHRFGVLGVRDGGLERTWLGLRSHAGGTGEHLIL